MQREISSLISSCNIIAFNIKITTVKNQRFMKNTDKLSSIILGINKNVIRVLIGIKLKNI